MLRKAFAQHAASQGFLFGILAVVKADTIESGVPADQEVLDLAVVGAFPNSQEISPVVSKKAIRTSLWASTWDGMFATIFSNVTGGVLLSNFMVELHASPTQIGLLSSIPMLANLIQPIGAFLGDRTNSRHNYCLWVYGPSRLLWLLLVAGIAFVNWQKAEPSILVTWTLAILFVTHFSGALGSAAWLSWLAALVPRRLRGRYFGIRNGASSLTNLLCVPLLAWLISAFPGGSIQGYGVILVLGILTGMISLAFQFLMVDVNPQLQHKEQGQADKRLGSDAEGDGETREQEDRDEEMGKERETHVGGDIETHPAQVSALAQNSELKIQSSKLSPPLTQPLRDTNFLSFLLYFSLWMFAVNLSAPFFNLYMLDNLGIDVRWVTIYTSLQAGANLLMLVLWGRLADRVGNRPILIAVGILVAVTPMFWLGTGTNQISLWLWLPLLHILAGVTWAAIDLCSNNLQLGVAPVQNQATYFAVAAAVAGVSGALGTTVGGFLAELTDFGGISTLFALSAVVRLVALLPLVFVHEQRGQSLHQMMRVLFPVKTAEESTIGD
jgi:MFS family permease